jgi:hypothetical protein
MRIIAAIQNNLPPPQTNQPPIGSLGWELPMLVGVFLGAALALLRNTAPTSPAPPEKLPTEEKPKIEESLAPTGDRNWINLVLKLPFRVLSGGQGSGKSTLERFMIAKLKADGWHVICINTETNPAVWRGVEVLTDAKIISEFFKNFLEWIHSRQQEARNNEIDEDDYLDVVAKKRTGREGRVAIFLQETNTYEPHGVDPDTWADFLKQCLTNIRKWGFTACFTAHSDNQTSVASKLSGFSKLLDQQPRIECIPTTSDTGEATSSGEAWLKMKGTKDPSPVKVKLENFPKTKDFRSPEERNSTNEALKEETNYSLLAEKLYQSCKGKGRLKVSRIPSNCNAIRTALQSTDEDTKVKILHLIIDILASQGKANLFPIEQKDRVPFHHSQNEFEII